MAGITPEEPLNVCNESDSGSVWYKFVAPTTGVYKLSAVGSDYSPNLTIMKQVSSTTRTPVVCGLADITLDYDLEYSKVAFNAVGGSTYLFEVSDPVGGGLLNLLVEKPGCSSDALCGAVVSGNGSVGRDARTRLSDNDGYYAGYGYGDASGFLSVTSYYGSGHLTQLPRMSTWVSGV